MGFPIYAKVHWSDGRVQVLFDVALLKGVPTWVIKVSNKVKRLFQITHENVYISYV
jgi:hypothetical protein